MTKPFRVGELVARVRAFLRRRGPRRRRCAFGECELDLAGHKVVRGSIELDLTAKEWALLPYFAARPGCALSRDTILNAVWGNAVFVTPTQYRSVCHDAARARSSPIRIARPTSSTIRDIGYRFEPGGNSDEGP